jgi:RNA polymerase sigma-70 factor (ECF subfamily)
VDTEPAADIEGVYRADGARLERALILFGGDREVARDAVAEAFAQALQAGGRIRNPQAWIWRVAYRTAASELQRRSRQASLPDEALTYEIPESLVDVLAALARLSPKQRASIVLHHYAGYPTRNVARIIGSTPAAVAVHLSVARRRLRGMLEDSNDES